MNVCTHAQTIGPRQHGGRDLAHEGVRAGHGRLGLRSVAALTHSRRGGGRLQRLEPLGLDGRDRSRAS